MTTRAVLAVKVCPYGCRYFNDGWHMENCPGPPVASREPAVWPERVDADLIDQDDRALSRRRPAFQSEPEYQREQQADERDRRHEAYEDQRLSYPEKGLHE